MGILMHQGKIFVHWSGLNIVITLLSPFFKKTTVLGENNLLCQSRISAWSVGKKNSKTEL